jgi:hypothetical protein
MEGVKYGWEEAQQAWKPEQKPQKEEIGAEPC